MKAVYTPSYGTPEVLEVRDVPVPEVGRNQVRVEVDAVAVTAGDRRMRSADFGGVTYLPGLLMTGVTRPRNPVQGTVFAGRICEIGTDVAAWAVGDDVFGLVMGGVNAESMVVDASAAMALRPQGLAAIDAVTLPYGAGTALYFLRDLGVVQPGERVLILGGSGGVGPYAVQVAKHLGAHVTATCSAAKMAVVEALGADRVLDYGTVDAAVLGQPYDVVFDVADASDFWSCRPILTPEGRYVSLTASLGTLGAMAATCWSSQRAYTGVAVDSRPALEELATMWWEGVLRPVVARRFAFPDLADAHRAVEAREGVGTVVVEVRSATGARPGCASPA